MFTIASDRGRYPSSAVPCLTATSSSRSRVPSLKA